MQNNVGVGGRERPADIYVTRWTDNEPVAVDVTITHPLAPHLGVNQQQARAVKVNVSPLSPVNVWWNVWWNN